MKQKKNKIISCSPGFTIDKDMPDYGKYPYFIEKTKRAIEFCLKHDMPGKLRKFLEERDSGTKKEK